MKHLREAIDSRLARIDFDALHKGFKKYAYALYDDTHVYLEDKVIEKDQRFIGNTAITYKGAYMAIWYKPEGDEDLLASNMVHEMFHCYQYERDMSVGIDDINATRYELDKAYLELKDLEKQYLVEAIQTLNKEAYSKVLAIREKRKEMNPVYSYELAMENFEGAAESCKLLALKTLNEATYDTHIQEGTSYILKEHFNTRRLAYYTGAYMNLLQALYPDTQADSAFDTTPVTDFENLLAAHKASIASQFKGFTKNETLKGRICGYDPMNLVGQGNEILHKHFVMIEENGEKRFIEGPIVTVSTDDAFEVIQVRHPGLELEPKK